MYMFEINAHIYIYTFFIKNKTFFSNKNQFNLDNVSVLLNLCQVIFATNNEKTQLKMDFVVPKRKIGTKKNKI